MQYRKISLEVIVDSQETEAVVAELNSALDRLGETYAIFGGDIETVAVEHSGMRRRSALGETVEAGKVAASAVKVAYRRVANAYRKVI